MSLSPSRARSVTRVGEADPATLPPPQSPAEERARIVDADGELAFDLDTLHKEDEDRTLEVTVVSFYHLQTHGGARAPGAGRGERAGCRRDFLVDFIGPGTCSPSGASRLSLMPLLLGMIPPMLEMPGLRRSCATCLRGFIYFTYRFLHVSFHQESNGFCHVASAAWVNEKHCDSADILTK